MTRAEVSTRIDAIAIIPAIRTATAADALYAANTITDAGIPIIELTMTVPGALKVIEELRRTRPEMIVGAGTVLDREMAERCIEAGAMFLSSPGVDPEIVEFTITQKIVSIPGALTPTEVATALKAGADYVKIFPCAQVGGPSYIKALKGPFPNAPLIASGGVNQKTAAEFLHAGATALGIGEELIPHDAIRDHKADWIQELARRFSGMVKHGRELRDAGHKSGT